MNTDRLRALMAEGLIIVAVIGAGHMLVAEPAASRVRTAEGSLRAMRATIDEAAELDSDELHLAQAKIAWMHEMSERSGDAARVYQTITAMGAKCGVKIDRVQPTPFIADDRHGRGLSGLGCSIVASGTYESLARFLDLVQSEAGFSAPTGLRLAPVVVDGEFMVQASIETMHRAVDLEAMAGAMAEAAEQEGEE